MGTKPPIQQPTDDSNVVAPPTDRPTFPPTPFPTFPPTFAPTLPLTVPPTLRPTVSPAPTIARPTFPPTTPPTPIPTAAPTTARPSRPPTEFPTFPAGILVTQPPNTGGQPTPRPTPVTNVGNLVVGSTNTIGRDGPNVAAPTPAAIEYIVDNLQRPSLGVSLPPAGAFPGRVRAF